MMIAIWHSALFFITGTLKLKLALASLFCYIVAYVAIKYTRDCDCYVRVSQSHNSATQ